MKKDMNQQQRAMHVSRVNIFLNLILSAFKLFAGIFAHSAAMVSDAIHSLSDVFSTLLVTMGIKMWHKAADKTHPYGHERFEAVTALLLALVLMAVGLGIGYVGITKIIDHQSSPALIPGVFALVAAALSLVIKEAMYWYTRAAAKAIHSSALMADAWHHRSDALSSIGSFVGILGARLGWPILDPIASVVICLFVLKAGITIFIDAIGKMTDRACDDATIEKMRQLILSQPGVVSIDQLKTRVFGNKIYVDVEIGANQEESLLEAHAIAHRVHDLIESQFANVKHCMIHVNPNQIN